MLSLAMKIVKENPLFFSLLPFLLNPSLIHTVLTLAYSRRPPLPPKSQIPKFTPQLVTCCHHSARARLPIFLCPGLVLAPGPHPTQDHRGKEGRQFLHSSTSPSFPRPTLIFIFFLSSSTSDPTTAFICSRSAHRLACVARLPSSMQASIRTALGLT